MLHISSYITLAFLAFYCSNGNVFGEEITFKFVAKPGPNFKIKNRLERSLNAGVEEELREATPVKDSSLNLVMDLTTENQQAVFSNPGLLFVVRIENIFN
jgi:hypothetical protein